MLGFLAWTIAYSWLSIESYLLLHSARQTATATVLQRMWPFSNSAVVYIPGQGISWQD
jgi:hypothetical protein